MKRKILKVLGVAAIAFLMACLVLFLFLYLLDKDSKEYVEQLEQEEQEKVYVVEGKELNEQEYNDYLSKQEELNKELTEGEKVVVYTIQQLQDALKNPHSLEIYSIHYKRQSSDNTGDYYIKVEYSANNDLGGTVENTLYYKFDIDVFSDDSEKALRAKMFGCKEVAFNEYDTGRRADYEETEINIDRILNNIDMVIIE